MVFQYIIRRKYYYCLKNERYYWCPWKLIKLSDSIQLSLLTITILIINSLILTFEKLDIKIDFNESFNLLQIVKEQNANFVTVDDTKQNVEIPNFIKKLDLLGKFEENNIIFKEENIISDGVYYIFKI